MDVSLLSVGATAIGRRGEFVQALGAAGAGTHPVDLPDPGERAVLDRALDARAGERLVIAANTGDLAAVLRRLGRRGELAERETAVLPLGSVPPFLARHGIVADLSRAADLAVRGAARTVGLLADDSSGLVVDAAELRPWHGRRLWVRAFVDDHRVCDGAVTALRVDRPPAGGLRLTVLGRFGRTVASVAGRAAQLACDEARLRSDGVERERPRRKRTWWDEPDLWRLAAPTAVTSAPVQPAGDEVAR